LPKLIPTNVVYKGKMKTSRSGKVTMPEWIYDAWKLQKMNDLNIKVVLFMVLLMQWQHSGDLVEQKLYIG